MARISFKAKIEPVYNADETLAYQVIRVPVLERRHCDMHAFRQHPKYGPYANSDLFPGILSRIRKDRLVGQYGNTIRMDRLPAGVSVDTSGFLVVVSLDA